MTNAVSVKSVQKEHTALYAEFVEAKDSLQDARSRYAEKKAAYCKFNNKYGRVLAMMKED
jgi:hypothetical protein